MTRATVSHRIMSALSTITSMILFCIFLIYSLVHRLNAKHGTKKFQGRMTQTNLSQKNNKSVIHFEWVVNMLCPSRCKIIRKHTIAWWTLKRKRKATVSHRIVSALSTITSMILFCFFWCTALFIGLMPNTAQNLFRATWPKPTSLKKITNRSFTSNGWWTCSAPARGDVKLSENTL